MSHSRPHWNDGMLAAVYHGRDAIAVEEIPSPGPPPPGWVTVAVGACGICGTDLDEVVHGPVHVPTAPHPLTGRRAPLVLGHEAAGRVIACGPGAGLEPGTRVGLENTVGCGACAACRAGDAQLCPSMAVMGLMLDGALAEAVNVPAAMCVALPPGLSYEAAALAEPLSVAVRAVRRAGNVEGKDVQIIGAGAIGLLCGQVARSREARNVIVRDPLTRRLGLARELGLEAAALGDRDTKAPVVIECSGSASGLDAALRATAKSGVTVVVGSHAAPRSIDLSAMVLQERSLVSSLSHSLTHDYRPALALLSDGAVDVEALITDRVPLARAVEDGFRPLIEQPAEHLKVLITCGESD